MVWILCIFILLFSGCEQKPQERHYKEIIIEALPVNAPSIPVPQQNILTWVTPEGWQEEAGTEMRMVSFHPIVDPSAIDCYITTLAGPAGGLEANLARWLGQLGLAVTDDQLRMLTASAEILTTKDGLECKVFDFTALQSHGLPLDKSMLAAMINLDQTTVFVKMTGSIKSVRQNRASFLKLLESIVRQ